MNEQDSTQPGSEMAMAWDGLREAPFLVQIEGIRGVVSFAEGEAHFTEALLEEGSDPQFGAITLSVAGVEKAAISAGLHLVGFFSGTLGSAARELMKRLVEENDRVLDAVTEEQKAEMSRLSARVEAKRTAQMFGLEGEELEEFLATFGGEEPAPDQGTWAAGEDDAVRELEGPTDEAA